jgi:hypothetical protein
MALELNTAGANLQYAVETTASTRPTTGYTSIPNIKSMPDLNPEPSSLEVTDLSDTEWKRYIHGLKDPGGALAFTANNTAAFQIAWAALVTAANTAAGTGKSTWFVISIPGLTDSFYFAGSPVALGLSAVEVDSVAEIDAYISPNQIVGWATAPTGA